MIKYVLTVCLITTSTISVAGIGNILKIMAPKLHTLMAARNPAPQMFTRAYSKGVFDQQFFNDLAEKEAELQDMLKDIEHEYACSWSPDRGEEEYYKSKVIHQEMCDEIRQKIAAVKAAREVATRD